MAIFRVIAKALCCVGLLLSFSAQADFKSVLATPALASHLASLRPLTAVVSADSRIVAVGQRGHIIYSDDAGTSWLQAKVPVQSDLTAVFFSSAKHGWAVGHEGVILATLDGGETWVLQMDGGQSLRLIRDHYGPSASEGNPAAKALLDDLASNQTKGTDKPFLDIWFANDSEGFVVGAFGLVLHTLDGGRSWEPWIDRTDNPKRFHLYSVKGDGKQIYLAGEQGILLRLNTTRSRFESIQSPYKGSLFGLLPTRSGLIVFGMRGSAYLIGPDGVTWKKLETGSVGGLTGATVLGEGSFALVSTAGELLVASQAGNAFRKLSPTRIMAFASVARVPGSQDLVLVGGAGVEVVPMIKKNTEQ